MLKNCPSEIKKTQLVARNEPPIVEQPVNNDDKLTQLQKENQELKLLISQLAERIDNKTVNGGY
jgi:hypothetical protein